MTWRLFVPSIVHEMAIITPSDQPLGQAASGLYDLITVSAEAHNKSGAGYRDAK